MFRHNENKATPPKATRACGISFGGSLTIKIAIAAAALVLAIAAAFVVQGSRAILSDSTDPIDNEFSAEKKHTLQYHGNATDTVGNLPAVQTEYGDSAVTFPISDKKPTRDGFVFLSWNTKPDGTGYSYAMGSSLTTEAVHTDLYAQWEIGYTLIYDANGGSNAPNAETQVSNQATHTFPNISGQADMTGPPEADGKAKHRVFLGWADTKDAKVPKYTSTGNLEYNNAAGDYDGAMSGFDSEVTISAPTRTKTIYAVWATRYTLDYSLHPKLEGSEGPVPAAQNKVTVEKQHTFKIPVRVTKEQAEADHTLTANAPSRKYKYYWGWWSDRNPYEKDGVTLNDTEVFDPAAGYQFNEDYRALQWDAPTQTLYACFQPPELATLRFDKQANLIGGETEADKVQNWPGVVKVSSTETVFKPKLPENNPTHDKYKFLGWAKEPGATEPDPTLTPGSIYPINKYIRCEETLYAVWQRKHKFKVNFNMNGGQYVYYKDEENSGNWARMASNAFRTNYPTTSVWYEDKFQTESKYYDDMERTWNADFWENRGLFATKNEDNKGTYKFMGWSFEQYKYDGSADEYREGDDRFTIDVPVAAPADPANPAGTEGIIQSPVTVKEEVKCAQPTTHTIELYAVWRRSPKHNYRIVFNRGNGTGLTGTTSYYSTSSSATTEAVDHQSYNWSVNGNGQGWLGWANVGNHPVASKNPDDTASYKFIGWAWDKNAETPDFRVDQTTGRIIEDIEYLEPAGDIYACQGGTHEKTLYPVFEPQPHHKFQLDFDANIPNLAGLETKIWKKNAQGTWTGTKTTTASYKSDAVPLTRTVFDDWNAAFWADNGIYASIKNTKLKPGDEEQKFKFLGWAWDKNAPAPDFPVTAPDDPDQAPTVLGQGVITSTVTLSEPTEGDNKCTDDKGQVHPNKLYGVWEYDRMHQYAVIFCGNGTGSDTQIKYRENDEWKLINGTTVPKGTMDFDDGELENALPRCWTYTSPAKKVPSAATEEYTFEASKWKDDDIGVSAVRASNDKYRYVFKGWSTQKGTDDNPAPVTHNVGTTGETKDYLLSDVKVKDNDTANCSLAGPETHNEILYAVWERVPIHKYSVLFYSNTREGTSTVGGRVRYRSGTGWANSTTGYYTSTFPDISADISADMGINYLYYCWRYIVPQEIDRSAGETEYTIPAGDWKSKNIGVNAEKNNYNGKNYKFLGWSDKPDNTVEYHVDNDGYIIDPVTIPNTGSEYDIHNKILYAVWEAQDEPDKHSFTISFNWNRPSGSSTPSSGAYFRTYNGTEWKDVSSVGKTFRAPAEGQEDVALHSSYTIEKEEWENFGLGANATVGTNINNYPCEYELVGWSKTRKNPSLTASASDSDVVWEHDPNSTFTGDGFIKSDITLSCEGHAGSNVNHSVTYYAVWKIIPRSKTYKLEYNLNSPDAVGLPDPVSGVEVYDGISWKNICKFTIPKSYMVDGQPQSTPKNKRLVFTGWADSPTAEQGAYGYVNPVNKEIEDVTSELASEYPMPYVGEGADDKKTLYAIWWYEYYLRFDANGGSQAPKFEHSYTNDTMYPFTISSDKPVRSGYEFLGWAPTPDATAPTYSPGSRYEMPAVTTGDDAGYTDITLYAVWRKL